MRITSWWCPPRPRCWATTPARTRRRRWGDSRRRRYVSLSGAYHGDTIGAVSVGGIELFHSVYGDLLFDCVPVKAPINRENEAALAAAFSDLTSKLYPGLVDHHYATLIEDYDRDAMVRITSESIKAYINA